MLLIGTVESERRLGPVLDRENRKLGSSFSMLYYLKHLSKRILDTVNRGAFRWRIYKSRNG